MVDLRVTRFDESLAEKWDSFVLEESMNGTFLQTRRFLSYHPQGRFSDASLIVWKGTSDILAVVPAARMADTDGTYTLWSHPGSTFGGPVLSSRFYNLDHVEAVIGALEEFAFHEGYGKIVMRPSSQVFSSAPCELLEYLMGLHGWSQDEELSFVTDLRNYPKDVLSALTGSRRRDYRYGERAGLEFRELTELREITEFYSLLQQNLAKFGTEPVHTLEELYRLRGLLPNEIAFYGTFLKGRMVAGSMTFLFGQDVFHTQYLAASQDDLKLFPNNYNDVHLIMKAIALGFAHFSFGISTEDRGRVLNRGLARFKEGFGTSYCVNRTFTKELI